MYPVDMTGLTERLKTPEGKRAHMDQMNKQSITLPMGYMVTFSIELNHPAGTMRHMSMSVAAPGRAPNEHALWMVCPELGFTGNSIYDCDCIWPEDLQRGSERAMAINVVQKL